MKLRQTIYTFGALFAGVLSSAQQTNRKDPQSGSEGASFIGSLYTACTDPALDGLAVKPASLSYATTSSHATRDGRYKGNYVLENGTLRFDVPGGAVYQVSVDRVQIAGTPVLGFQNNKLSQQTGFNVREDGGDGLLRFENQIWFWLCEGAAYPSGNSIAFLRDDTYRSECKPVNLRWRPLRPEPVNSSPPSRAILSDSSLKKNKAGRIRNLDEKPSPQGLSDGKKNTQEKRLKVGAQRFAKLGDEKGGPGRLGRAGQPRQRVNVAPVGMTPQMVAPQTAKQNRHQKRSSMKGMGSLNRNKQRRSKVGL